MTRFQLQSALGMVILAVLSLPSAKAQGPRQAAFRQSPRVTRAYYAPPKTIVIDPHQRGGAPQAMPNNNGSGKALPAQPGYVYLNAPLYPTPRPDVPYQVGSTYITNPAFAPHEMLYPHTYRAMYPPYFYRARGMTAFGKTHEVWELEGTEVEIEYRSSIPMFSRFRNPFETWPWR
ncbi:MAG: hypothetical protein ACE5KM_04590 [Planctomycetaceae bacterium]